MDKRGQFFPLRDDNPRERTPFVTWSLIAINIVVFLISLTDLESFVTNFGFTPAQFSLLTMFTSMFLHGGIAHIAGNMWFLFIFGDNVESALGRTRYVIFYLVTGLLASLAHVATSQLLGADAFIPCLGASGAISGVLGGYILLFPHRRVRVLMLRQITDVPAIVAVGMWFAFQLISGLGMLGGASGGVAYGAHIGGFLAGLVLVRIFRASGWGPAAGA